MAISTSTYHSNSLPSGELSVGVGIDLFANSTTPKVAVGTKAQRADGNIYRYGHFGAATAVGLVVSPDLNESQFAYNDNSVIATNSAFQQATESTGVYPGMVGSKYVVLLESSRTADQIAGGYITISSGTGIGYTYRVKGNKASNGTACTVELYDAILVGLDASSDVTVAASNYANLEAAVSGTTRNSLAVGVSVTAMSSGNFGWILTKGNIGIMDSGGLTQGKMAVLSSGEPGNVEAYGLGAGASDTGSGLVTYLDAPVIGQVANATATSGHCVVNVRLE